MAEVTHEVRNSLFDATRVFRLEPDGLSWMNGTRREHRRYAELARLHLIAYPGVGGPQFQCTLTDRAGAKLKIRSHHYKSLGAFEDRSGSYGAFVRALAARLDREGGGTEFCRGSNVMRAVWLSLFTLGCLVLVGYGFALVGGPGVSWGSIAPLVVLAVFLPVSWSMIGQSWSGTFDPKAPPAELLGRG